VLGSLFAVITGLVINLTLVQPACAHAPDLDDAPPAAKAMRVILPTPAQTDVSGMRVILPGVSSVAAVREPSRSPVTAAIVPSVLPSTTAPVRRTVPILAPELAQQIVHGARLQGLDPYLVKAVIQTESNFNPHAVSSAKAVGLMQVLPQTATDVGLKPQGQFGVTQLLHDPWVSILVGTRYLADQLERFGRVDLALAAYNAGPAAVQKAGLRIPPFPETQAYVARVLANWRALKRAQTLDGVI
jgi:soluble lytic murein transglycosylase-like protein